MLKATRPLCGFPGERRGRAVRRVRAGSLRAKRGAGARMSAVLLLGGHRRLLHTPRPFRHRMLAHIHYPQLIIHNSYVKVLSPEQNWFKIVMKIVVTLKFTVKFVHLRD